MRTTVIPLIFLHCCSPSYTMIVFHSCTFIVKDFTPAPGLLVHGPSGSGKTDICHNLLSKMHPDFHARISCDSFSTSKQLVKAIWMEILRTRFKFDSRNVPKSSKTFMAYQNSLGHRAPSNFGDLASTLGPFLDSFLLCKNSFYSTRNISRQNSLHHEDEDGGRTGKAALSGNGRNESSDTSLNVFGYNPSDGSEREGVFYLLLDQLDAAEKLERGLCNSLLRLSEVNKCSNGTIRAASNLSGI